MCMALTVLQYKFILYEGWFQIMGTLVQRIRKHVPELAVDMHTDSTGRPDASAINFEPASTTSFALKPDAIPISERRWECISSVNKTVRPFYQVSKAMSRLLRHSSGVPKELDGAVANRLIR